MSSTINLRSPTRPLLQKALAVATGLILLATALVFSTAPVGAQTPYGGNSTYGSDVYATGSDSEAGTSGKPMGVKPPNTGYRALENLQRAAKTQPFYFWGSVSTIAIALTVATATVRQLIKRKQEN